MIRRYAAAALAASSLLAAWPTQAAAKGVPQSVGLCGPSACVRIADRTVRLGLARTEGEIDTPAPTLAPYLRLTTRPHLFGVSGYLVPAQGVVVLAAGTFRLGPRVLGLVRSRLAGVAAYRPRIGRVWVDGRPATDPAAYAAILRRPPVTPLAAIWRARSMSIAITVDGATPWAAWDSARYFPRQRLLHVPDGTWIRVTAAEAAMVAQDSHPSRSGGGGGAALPIALALAASAALAVGAVRIRPRWRPRGA